MRLLSVAVLLVKKNQLGVNLLYCIIRDFLKSAQLYMYVAAVVGIN